jgi:chaperone required for assembly of F1-ATPase
MYAPQPAGALARLRDEVHALDAFRLAAFHDLVSLSGSLVLGFAVARARLSAAEAWDLSVIDEAWQAEQWGEDDEATAQAEIRREAFLHARRFFDLAGAR